MTVAYIGALLGVVFLAWAAFAFNALVRSHSRVNESWSGVDVQLKRRHDLVPNLVKTVAAYAQHEHATMEAMSAAYETASTSSGRRGRQAAEHDLSQAIADVRGIGERYPDLKASENFHRLQLQLAEIDGEIQYARRIYNSNVELYNSRVRGFPGLLVRKLGGFRPMGYFELSSVWRTSTDRAGAADRQQVAAA